MKARMKVKTDIFPNSRAAHRNPIVSLSAGATGRSNQLKNALPYNEISSTMELPYIPSTPQQALTYNQGSHQQMEMDFTQPINYNQHIPIAQENMQIEP